MIAANKNFAALLIIAIIAVTALGFAFMNHDGGCVFGGNFPAGCPLAGLEMAVRHIAAYESFTAGFIRAAILAFLILTIGLVRRFRQRFRKNSDIGTGAAALWRRRLPRPPSPSATLKWLSLFENSPSIF